MCYLLTIKEKCIQDPSSVFYCILCTFSNMNSTIKRKGGPEKVRQNIKKMLTLIGQKCAKVSDFFKLKQTNGNSSTNILPGSTGNLYYTYYSQEWVLFNHSYSTRVIGHLLVLNYRTI